MLQGTGAGFVLTALTSEELQYIVQLLFKGATNNMAEYEGLLVGLWATTSLRIPCFLIKRNSQLIVN